MCRAAFDSVLLLCAGATLVACSLREDVPETGVFVCRNDDECPPAISLCDTVRHVCVASGADLSPPHVVDVSFDPPAAKNGLVALVVHADEALSLSSPPTVEFSGAPLILSAPSILGADATFVVDVDTLVEGVYLVSRVTITDVQGNVGSASLVDTALLVDRTAATLRNAEIIDAPSGGIFADVTGFDRVSARFLASEPLTPGGATMSLGGRTASCTDDIGVLAFRCSLSVIGAGVGGGDVNVTLSAVDEAGNASSSVLTVPVDTAAPVVIEDSVAVSINTEGVPGSVARSDSSIVVSFVVDEALASSPLVVLDTGPSSATFVLDSVSGNRWTFSRTGFPALSDGAYPIVASVSDPYGHVATQVPLVSIAFVASGSNCTLPAAGGCLDFDGDGFESAACLGTDDDDIDPTTFPGADDIPGDGRDNNSIAGDVAISATNGLFVGGPSCDDSGSGTPDAPFCTLHPVTAQTGDFALFFAASPDPYPGSFPIPAQAFIGGLDPETWQHIPGATSRLELTSDGYFAVAIDSIETDATVGVGSVVARSEIGRALNFGFDEFRLHDSRVQDVIVPQGSVRVTDSTIGTMSAAGNITVLRSRVQHISSPDGTHRVVAIASVLGAGIDAAVDCSACGGVELFHAIVDGRLGTRPGVTILDAPLLSVGTLWRGADLPLVEASGSAQLTFASNAFEPQGALVTTDADTVFSVDDLNACAFAGCAQAAANITYSGDDSVLRDRGVDATGFGAPTSVATDLDGSCRYNDGSPDIGPEEL